MTDDALIELLFDAFFAGDPLRRRSTDPRRLLGRVWMGCVLSAMRRLSDPPAPSVLAAASELADALREVVAATKMHISTLGYSGRGEAEARARTATRLLNAELAAEAALSRWDDLSKAPAPS